MQESADIFLFLSAKGHQGKYLLAFGAGKRDGEKEACGGESMSLRQKLPGKKPNRTISPGPSQTREHSQHALCLCDVLNELLLKCKRAHSETLRHRP